MSIFSKLKKLAAQSRLTDSGGDQRDERTVSFVLEQAKRRRLQRTAFSLQWQLNTNFLYGNQHCDINTHRMTVEDYEPMYDYLSREVFNRIAPLMETRLANLQTVRYGMTVLPRTNEYEDAMKAEISTALLRAKQEQSAFSEKLDLALHWSELTGSAFFYSGWNSDGGEVYEIPTEEGEEKTLHSEGDVEYSVLSPYEVLPDSLYCESVTEQESILIEQVKSVTEIENLYGKKVRADSVAVLGMRAANGASIGKEAAETDSTVLYTYMERPNCRYPEGRLILVASDTLLCETAFPYRNYPLCQMKSQRVPGQFYGKSVIENLIPLQRSYNGIKNKINDYINQAASGQLLIEEGSLDSDDLCGNGIAPGIPVVYERGSEKPSLLPMPSLPSIVSEQCDRIAADMEYVSGVSQLLVSGRTPDGITSGTAIKTLRNIDSTRLSMTADNAREAVRALAVIWLWLYHDFGGENRAIIAKGRNAEAGVLYWSADQIDSFEVIFDTENELKDSEQDRFDRLLAAMEKGLYGKTDGEIPRRVLRKARQALGLESLGVTLEEDLQEQNAQNENLSIEKGKEIGVGRLDDHVIHLEEHRMYALQRNFADMVRSDPQKAERMFAHIALHEAEISKKEGGLSRE